MDSPDFAFGGEIEDPRFFSKEKSGDTRVMFKTYILNLVDGSYYVGSTGNLEERVKRT